MINPFNYFSGCAAVFEQLFCPSADFDACISVIGALLYYTEHIRVIISTSDVVNTWL